MKQLKIFIILMVLSLSASAQWQTISGNPQKNNVTGDYRWNFGIYGLFTPIPIGQKAAINGLATLDSTGKVPQSQLNAQAFDLKFDTLAKFSNNFKRNDASAVFKLDNGNLIILWGKSGSSGGDTGQFSIYCKRSTDGGVTYGADSVLIPQVNNSSMIPSVARKANGNLVVVFFSRVTTSTIPSKIYRAEFTQGLVQVGSFTDITPTGVTGLSYYPAGQDRLFYDSINGLWLYPYSNLLSGSGTSTASVYEGRMLVSSDLSTFTDAGISIGSSLLFPVSGFGGISEPGVYYTPQNGLVYYGRTLIGSVYASKLTYSGGSYSAGTEFPLFSAANANATIKYWSQKNLLIGIRNRLNNLDYPVNSTRNQMDIITSNDGGTTWDENLSLDNSSGSVDVFEPSIYIDNNNQYLIATYSKTFSSGYNLYQKRYPAFLIRHKNNPIQQPGSGLVLDYSRKLTSGMSVKNPTTSSAAGIVTAVKYPSGGVYQTLTSSTTGAIKIQFPSNNIDEMVTLKVSVQQRATGAKSFDAIIKFYPNQPSTANTATIIGEDNSVNYNIRFCTNGTTPVVYIGELNTTWSFMHVAITEVIASRVTTLTAISSGWVVGLESSAFVSTPSEVKRNNFPNANQKQIISLYTIGANTPISNTDSLTDALGKLQGQLSAVRAISLGGTGTGTAPSIGQLLIATSTSAYTPTTVSGDITNSAGVFTIGANKVTYAKMQAVSATSRLLGSSSTTTPVQEILLGFGHIMSGNTLLLDTSGTGVRTVANSLSLAQLQTKLNLYWQKTDTGSTLASKLYLGKYLPLNGTTHGLDMNGKNISNAGNITASSFNITGASGGGFSGSGGNGINWTNGQYATFADPTNAVTSLIAERIGGLRIASGANPSTGAGILINGATIKDDVTGNYFTKSISPTIGVQPIFDSSGNITPATGITSPASSLTLVSGWYTFTGTTTTWVLPTFASSVDRDFYLVNQGTGDINLTEDASDIAAAYMWMAGTGFTGLTIHQYDVYHVHNNGIYFVITKE